MRRDHRVLVLLTAAFVLSGAAFALATPVFENPDEATHVDMVRHYAKHPTKLAGPSLRQTQAVRGAFAATGLRDEPTPSAIESIPATRPDYGPFADYGGEEPATSCPVTCQNYQYIHPPGWYLLAAPIVVALDSRPFPQVVAALRLFNVLLGAVLVWATWYIARQVWPDHPRRALLAAGFTACCGPLAATLASVNNDALMLALMGVALALMAHILRHGTSPRPTLALGAVVGLGLVTKGQFLPVGVIAFAVIVLAPQVTSRVGALLRYLIPAGLGGLWWLRVLIDTHSFTPRGSELVPPPSDGPWRHVSFARFFADRIDDFLEWFPGRYGWLLVTVPGLLLWALAISTVVLAVGWLAARRWRRPAVSELRFALLAAVPVALLLVTAKGAYDTFHATGTEHGLAPRYVYGAIPIFAVGTVAALSAIGGRLRLGRYARLLQVAALWTAAVVGTVVSLVVALRGEYFTHSVDLLFDRARIVAPLPHLKSWLAVLGVFWLATLAAASWTLWRPEPRDRGTGHVTDVTPKPTIGWVDG